MGYGRTWRGAYPPGAQGACYARITLAYLARYGRAYLAPYANVLVRHDIRACGTGTRIPLRIRRRVREARVHERESGRVREGGNLTAINKPT